MSKCAIGDCQSEAEHRLQMVPASGTGMTGYIAVCSRHVADVERNASGVMAAVQGDRSNAAGERYRVEPRPDNIVPLYPAEDRHIEAAVKAEADVARTAIEEALDWHRAHPGSDHVDAAYAAAGHAGDLGHSRWPGFVAAVKEVTEAADAIRAAGLEAER
jgi:hypothetical protein